MKTVTRSAPFKFLLVFLTSVCLLSSALLGTACAVLEINGFYADETGNPIGMALENEIANNIYRAWTNYESGRNIYNLDPNFVYSITDIKPQDGKESNNIVDNGIQNSTCQTTLYYVGYLDREGNYTSFLGDEKIPTNSINVTYHYEIVGGYRENPVAEGKMYFLSQWTNFAYNHRLFFPVATIVGLVLTVIGMIFVCILAGKRKYTEQITPNRVDRVPFDIFLLLFAGIALCIVCLSVIIVDTESIVLILGGGGILAIGSALLIMLLVYTVATRWKSKTLIQNCIITRLIQWCFRGIFKAVTHVIQLLKKIPTVPKTASIAAFFAFCNILLGYLTFDFAVFVLLTMESVLGFLLAVAVALSFSTLQKQAKSLAKGELDHTMDTKYLIGPFKEHGEDLNRIGEGLNAAVSDRIKSERMKTELITNVSHDIKTPLTSIINYTDLLSKEPKLSNTAEEYIQVLQRQSARLKKLTEDIVEASKASSGAITLTKEPCDLGVLLEQTVGEYEDKTSEQQLKVLLSKPETAVTVLADGRRVWRIFDNLMNNICKYALPGTRVYLSLTEQEKSAIVTFRNISKNPLNIAPEELTERFVRGDTARSSEGSGLGLAIAQSLTELQQGKFEISIDADLFKVTLIFPLQENDSR